MFSLRRLDIYLNDHLAGATAGLELARRAAGENAGTSLGDFLQQLVQEIAEDKETLETVMARLEVDRSPGKPAAAWVLEKIGRLKLNGQLRGYSPLSRLIELETLESGVTGKRSLWQALAHTLSGDPHLQEFDFPGLIARADRELVGLGEHRRAAASAALLDLERAAS
jgi:hypothetical protein